MCKKIPDLHIEIQNLMNKVNQIEEEYELNQKKVIELEKNGEIVRLLSESIDIRLSKFGQVGEYKFDANWKTLTDTFIENTKTEIDKLSREVNDNIQTILSTMKEEIKELNEKRDELTKDLRDLLDIIDKNEPLKRAELNKAFKEVSDYMGEIFQILLPDSDAKLEMKDKNDITQGIKVRICFNGDWNYNLSTLSGGQKSFMVVSLIFAMLKKNPAPIYILDEIDAPLDENNT
mmetsp:Transcript_53630/g.45032  ORF Transcript_53630/g.45032 Transcript_53630/m.45032 type:complete len:233 (+) Transcript_53630:2740-3438(+)